MMMYFAYVRVCSVQVRMYGWHVIPPLRIYRIYRGRTPIFGWFAIIMILIAIIDGVKSDPLASPA